MDTESGLTLKGKFLLGVKSIPKSKLLLYFVFYGSRRLVTRSWLGVAPVSPLLPVSARWQVL